MTRDIEYDMTPEPEPELFEVFVKATGIYVGTVRGERAGCGSRRADSVMTRLELYNLDLPGDTLVYLERV